MGFVRGSSVGFHLGERRSAFTLGPQEAGRLTSIAPFGSFPLMKVREAIKMLEADGWYLDRTRGSHRQFKHSQKRGLVTIAGKPNDDLAPGTKSSILKQAGLK